MGLKMVVTVTSMLFSVLIQNTQADFFFGILQNRNKYIYLFSFFKIT